MAFDNGKQVAEVKYVDVINIENLFQEEVISESREKLKKDTNKVYDSGTYKVGVDIPAGEYKITTTSNDKTGTVFVLKVPNRIIENVIAHEIFTNSTYVSKRRTIFTGYF
ncbi:hypothetical protein [Cricetibacter osteomyelitidis]|uniref:hypothetical protein n=1 Tax=Cricetibacter osteomyelitidis TaxID=1521931 RepID=UPI0010471C41|nr:hypothetical protein [Cricetibacter osteomyelitidis]